jgi:DNA-binding GntR family transcriptional regulator
MLPSIRQLAREWGVSDSTAERALDTLRAEGYVQSVHGVGTFVVSASTAMGFSGRDRLRTAKRTGRIYPPNERAVIKSAELVLAPDSIADALGVAAGARVIRRHRVTYRDDVPVSASTTWMYGELAQDAPRLLTTERITEGTAGYVQAMTGRAVARGLDQTSARLATEEDAADLGVPVGSPVACGRNWWRASDGYVIEYGESVSVPGRWTSSEYTIG